MPNWRGLLVRTRTMPLPTARPTRLVSRNDTKSSGKSVTTSTSRVRPAPECPSGPGEALARQEHLPRARVDSQDEVFDERKLELALRRARLEPDDEHIGARVADEVLDDADFPGRPHEPRADDVAHVE